MEQISLKDARARLSELVGRADDHHEEITITLHGRPAAVLMSVYEYESMRETLDLLSDDEAMADLRQAEADIEAGRVASREDVAGSMQVAGRIQTAGRMSRGSDAA